MQVTQHGLQLHCKAPQWFPVLAIPQVTVTPQLTLGAGAVPPELLQQWLQVGVQVPGLLRAWDDADNVAVAPPVQVADWHVGTPAHHRKVTQHMVLRDRYISCLCMQGLAVSPCPRPAHDADSPCDSGC